MALPKCRHLLLVAALPVLSLRSQPAAAQIVANGTSLTVTTSNAVASFAGADLVGLVNSTTNETYLTNPSAGELAAVNAFVSTGPLQLSNWTLGTEPGTGLPIATITVHDSARTLTVAVKIDPTSQEIVLRSTAAVTTPGLRDASWSIAGLNLANGRLIVPANTGIVFDLAHPIGTFVEYPNTWHAQMVVYESSLGSFVLYSTDTQMAFKQLRTSTRGESTMDVAVATQAVAPFGSATTVPAVEWRLKAFTGNWRVAAQIYRDWLNANRPPISNAAHPWVSNIRAVVCLRTIDTNVLAPLAAQVVPSQTLIYLPDWRQYPYDVSYPDYTPRAGVSSFVAAAHALGFKVMLHLDLIGVSPGNPDYASVQAWQVRTPESLQLIGWKWELPPSTPFRFAYINLAASTFRSLWITRVSAAVNAIGPDALHLDISSPMYNDGNGLIGGMSYPQGSAQFHQEIVAAFPNLALGGEGENDIIYRYHAFAQAWWPPTTANPGHPIATFLFGPHVQYYGHLSQAGAREPQFKNDLVELERRAILPQAPINSTNDLDMSDSDNARLFGLIQSWQSHAFQPAWTSDWTGAVVRYDGLAASTAALTETGTQTTLTAAGATLFTLAHDTGQLTSASFVRSWPAFDATNIYGLDPGTSYFLDPVARPTSTHVTSLPAGVRLGPASVVAAGATHIETLPPAVASFDFEVGLLTSHVGVRYQGVDTPLGNGAVIVPSAITAGGDTRSGLFIHPPYQAQIGGETFAEYSLPIPAGATLQFDVGVADNASCTDGVTFRVTVSGTLQWQQHFTRTGWHHVSLSLAAFGGSTVPLRIISNPGPANDPYCDWAVWNHVTLTAPASALSISVPLALGAGSVFSGFDGDGSFSLSGLSATVSNLPVPGHFTIFTQPGAAVSSGINLASLPFQIWHSKHDELVLPGAVFGAGAIGTITAGGVTKSQAISAHPPFGRTELSWSLHLPGAPLRLWWSAGLADGATTFDGVDFRVAVNGVTCWQRTLQSNQWIPGNIDLDRWKGQNVLIQLITDSRVDNYFDWAYWADLVLRDSAFSDTPLTPAVTTIKAVHVTELRLRIDALRARSGLAVYGWSDPSLTAGATMVRAQHVIQLRAALAQVYGALGVTPPTYTDPALAAGMPIKAAHISELRSAVIAIE